MRRGLLILLVMSLLVAACGGGGAETSVSTNSTEAKVDAGTAPPAADTSTTQPEASDEPVASGEEGTGTATIGDTTYEFTVAAGGPGAVCDMDASDAGLIFVIVMYGEDDEGRQIALNLGGPISGGDDIVVQVGSPTSQFERWTADRSVYDGFSGIEIPEGIGATVQVGGNTVSGSGVFYDVTPFATGTGGPFDAGVLEGTFSATCPAS